jgi:long-chain acyl-CoA synthetase
MESEVGKENKTEHLYFNRPWLKFYPEGLPSEIDIPDISLIQAFDKAVEKWRNKTALIFYGKKMSYLELKDQINRFATALYDLGIRKGDTVALFLLNCPQFVIAYFGALRIGAVLTPISPVYVTPEVKHQLEDSHAETIICLDILYDFIEKANVGLKRIILTRIDEYLPSVKKLFGKSVLKAVYQKMEIPKVQVHESENIYWFQDLIKKSQPNPPKIEINPKEDLAALPYTGGTTGSPKGAMLTHYNVFAMQVINQTFWSYSFEKGKNLEEGKETVVAFLPFYHIYGQVILLISGIVRGYTLVVLTTPDLDDVLSSVGGYGATFFMGVPALYELLKDYDKIGRVDWKRLKLFISGADSLLEDTAKTWEKRTGILIHEGYGLTETSAGICVNPIGRPKMGSFGVPLPNTMVAIAHPERAEMVLLGEIGELVVKGPQVMKGYWNRPEETKQSFVEIMGEKWLRTGDLVRMDDEGYVHFYDRKRDLIKYKGYSIFAREIEEVIKTHPKIKEAAVIGVPDPKVGANIKAVIVLQSDARGRMSEEEIVSYCQGKLAHYKIPKIIEFRGEIPRTDVGKVSRRELREEREV